MVVCFQTLSFSKIYEAGALPLEVRHDISYICSEIVHLDFDHNRLLMLPGTALVHKRMEYTHFFTGGLVGGNRSVKRVCRYPFEFHVPCKSGDEMDAVLTVCVPVHEVVGAEVGFAPDYYLVYSLAEHFRLAVYNHRFTAGVFDTGFDAFYDAA